MVVSSREEQAPAGPRFDGVCRGAANRRPVRDESSPAPVEPMGFDLADVLSDANHTAEFVCKICHSLVDNAVHIAQVSTPRKLRT